MHKFCDLVFFALMFDPHPIVSQPSWDRPVACELFDKRFPNSQSDNLVWGSGDVFWGVTRGKEKGMVGEG